MARFSTNKQHAKYILYRKHDKELHEINIYKDEQISGKFSNYS